MHNKAKNFKDIRIKAGLFNINDAAAFLGVTTRTIKNWDKSGSPVIAVRALEYRAGIADKWNGFYFREGIVTTPVNDCYNAVEVELIKYFNIQCYKLGASNHRLPNNLSPKIPNLGAFRRAKTEFEKRGESA